VPDQIKLLPNYPNPFRGQTTLRFALPEQQEVRLVIYDVLGRTVRTLVNQQKQSGVHSVNWNGRNDAGQPVASGLYLGRLEVGETTQVTKLLLVK
jgi:flagellar hook assembly protein FlgD